MAVHKEGYTVILVFLVILAAIDLSFCFLFPHTPVATGIFIALSVILFVLIIRFFRSPVRTVITDNNAIYAPADGKIVVIEKTNEPEYFQDQRIQISIFMSPFNVHVNWFPVSGEVVYYKYYYGKYLVAWHPKSSENNERTSVVIKNSSASVLVRQIAGAVARRIVCYAKEGGQFVQGSQLGFIKFGSRVDIFLPPDARINVQPEEKVKGNKTVLAYFK